MGLFRKTHNTEESSKKVNNEVATTSFQPNSKLSAKENAHLWWQAKYGEDMPQEIEDWVTQLTKAEARKMSIGTSILTPEQEQKTKEAKTLSETKLKNLERLMHKVRTQKDWLIKYKKLQEDLANQTKRLHEINKQLICTSNDEERLKRFETFENIQGEFQRMQLLIALSRDNKNSQSALAREVETAQHLFVENRKQLTLESEKLTESEKQITQVLDNIEEAHKIIGARNILDIDIKMLEDYITKQSLEKKALTKKIEEEQNELEVLQRQLTEQSTRRQALEPHRQMLERGKQVLLRLNFMNEIHADMQAAAEQYEKYKQKLRTENELLERAFAQYQKVNTEIQTMMAEIAMHRNEIATKTGYSLQERAMKLKIRRQMLSGAQSLWERIRRNYQELEEKSIQASALGLKIDTLKYELTNLEKTLEAKRKDFKEKEYTLNVGKSKNVMWLRGDLKEGINCMVCGATHHPYHSDTMLEQNKLISDMNSEVESEQAELTQLEKKLMALRLDVAGKEAQQRVEINYRLQLQERLARNVKEWEIYADLGPSFVECSPSTNRDARSGMIRQLIENSAREGQEAQHELDTYNYHQTRINEISEALAKKEQEKNEINTQMNEVNIGCQVLTHQADLLQKRHKTLQLQYTNFYEETNKSVSLADWFCEWQTNKEGLKQRIAELINHWNTLNDAIRNIKSKEELLSARLDEHCKQEKILGESILRARNDMEQRKKIYQEGENTYKRLFGEQDVKEYFQAQWQAYEKMRQNVAQQRKQLQKASSELAQLEGQLVNLQETGEFLDQKKAEEQGILDAWMRRYNANHPPVRYTELEQAFMSDIDWNDIRKLVRKTRIEATIAQNESDKLREEIMQMQAVASHTSALGCNITEESLQKEQEKLERQYREESLNIAKQEITLTKNEQFKKHLQDENQNLEGIILP